MLQTIGVKSIEDLFSDVPVSSHKPRLPADPLSEDELEREVDEMLGEFQSVISPRYVPASVDEAASRNEFYTAYTSYQSELSQGMLQALFEFQSLVAELTGMGVVSSSLYDGGAALGEAAFLAKRVTGKDQVLVSASAAPQRKAVLKTYASGAGLKVVELPFDEDGQLDLSNCDISEGVAMLYVESPNYFGVLEEGLSEFSEWAHSKGALFAVGVDLLSLSVLRPPSDFGVDLTISEGLGGHPYGSSLLGVLAAKAELSRQMPGKLVGATSDSEGRLAFALTLLTREQSIRRERATSNVTTDAALSALRAAAYISLLGQSGMAKIAEAEVKSAHDLCSALASAGFESPSLKGPFWNAFVARVPNISAKYKQGIGIPLWNYYPLYDQVLLRGIPEKEVASFVSALEEVAGWSP